MLLNPMKDSVVGVYDVELFRLIILLVVYRYFIPFKDLLLLKNNWKMNKVCDSNQVTPLKPV